MSERADGFSLDEIVARFGGELVGDGSRRITQVAPLERATADQISCLANPKCRQQLQGTRAGAVILTPAAATACPGFHIICANPYAYYARVAQLLNPPRHDEAGIHPSAVVAANVPGDTHVGAHVFIDAEALIGPGTVNGPGCVGNGYFDFWHAFWFNEIDYDRFYRTLPPDKALRELAEEISAHRTRVTVTQRPFEREVVELGSPERLNVVLVSVESFSAEFMAAFGNRQGITPELDRLSAQGLLFTHIYATGTRTVRGREALALSVPPTPGHSIVKRPANDHLFTLGEVFNSIGYESLYLYGGYGYFDNMTAFFSGNGYTVVDRTALAHADVHFENIWGVADEDLFDLTLRELDRRHDAGKPFFAHVMTTSNHRPFTYREGRIDIPSHTGREGGVRSFPRASRRSLE